MSRLPVSLVVPTIGRIELPRDCLRSVAAGSALPAEVLLVDQSGGEALARLIADLPALPIRRVRSGARNVAVAYNAGIRAARQAIVAVTHDDVGGFDEAFARAAEDGDLCFRRLRSGRTLRYEPAMTVWHRDWRSRDELRALNVQYAFDQGRMYGKHLWRRGWAITLFVARDAREALTLLRNRLRGLPVAAADWRRGIAPGLPAGLVVGLAHQARRSLRQARCR